ncbi:MAG TPA: hypothetical protein PKM93_11860 [Prolixibacteraceae bacterium]|nr:hypothetical protein [Prolixibacteraceae bacterium]HNZ70029.1 hypothetical protein [Prolixibacteraceae bacterium]
MHPSRKQRLFDLPFKGVISVKDAIESLGVPHTAVDLVLINGEPETLNCRLQQGDLVSVYPQFETFDVGEVSRIRKRPLRVNRNNDECPKRTAYATRHQRSP